MAHFIIYTMTRILLFTLHNVLYQCCMSLCCFHGVETEMKSPFPNLGMTLWLHSLEVDYQVLLKAHKDSQSASQLH